MRYYTLNPFIKTQWYFRAKVVIQASSQRTPHDCIRPLARREQRRSKVLSIRSTVWIDRPDTRDFKPYEFFMLSFEVKIVYTKTSFIRIKRKQTGFHFRKDCLGGSEGTRKGGGPDDHCLHSNMWVVAQKHRPQLETNPSCLSFFLPL